jgi:hypothetical protein
MSYFPDLSRYTYLKRVARPDEVNIGWLDGQHQFPQGDVPERVLAAIFELCQRRVNQTRGYHHCELCPPARLPYTVEELGTRLSLGSAEIRVAGRLGVKYACPDLIYHYVRDHRYRPPQEFIDAVLNL